MCKSCVHNNYCLVAFKKDHWCGNYLKDDINRADLVHCMTIDEAIVHALEQAKEYRRVADHPEVRYAMKDNQQKYRELCLREARECEQLAGWLKELKGIKEGKHCSM